jgi:hypothetical protein
MSDEGPPQVGTRDFFHEASELLQKSDTPHLLICAFDRSPLVYRSVNITQLEGVDWFRRAANILLDDVEKDLRG